MITAEHSPTLVMICTILLLFIGFFTLAFGKKIPAKGSWLIWAGLIALLTSVGFDTGFFIQESFTIKTWMAGWIWSKQDVGAITVGILQDPIGMSMTVLSALVAAVFLMNYRVLVQETRSERAFSALAISVSGVILAWNSLTPWLVFAGISLTIIGGFLGLGSHWDSNTESSIAMRFTWEKTIGFLLAFFGACILGASRMPLMLNQPEAWSTIAENELATGLGTGLLVVGLFIHLQPFPFLGWLVSNSEVYSPVRTLLNQIFPAWAAFSLLIRVHPQLVKLGFFPGFGWVALVSSLITILSGLFQNQWRLGLGVWISAGYSLSLALLAFSGPISAFALIVGVSLGAFCLSISASALEKECIQNDTQKQKANWIKTAALLATAGGTGVLGFVSVIGGMRWIAQGFEPSGMIAINLLILFIFVMLGWKILWNIWNLGQWSDASWLSITSLFVLVICSLGFVWTGTASGEVVPGAPDRLFGSLFDQLFGSKSELGGLADFGSISGFYWGTVFVAFMTAYWTSSRKEDRWKILGNAFPKLSRFLAQGYGIDFGIEKLGSGIFWIGRFTEKLVDEKIWEEWIPNGLSFGVTRISGVTSKIDGKFSLSLEVVLRKLIEIPAKILQLIQTGDLRWYLFFALSSGFALLVHFLKLRGI